MAGLGVVQAAGEKRIIIYEDVVTEVGPGLAESKDLWVTTADLAKATKFVIKPQGVCRDELCFPLPKARKREFLVDEGKTTWFNLDGFGRLLKQPVAHDELLGVWYFGPRPDQQNAHLASLEAPDFTLPDVTGKLHSLSELRGKKVLLVTWASW
jgi:hypothetical protein